VSRQGVEGLPGPGVSVPRALVVGPEQVWGRGGRAWHRGLHQCETCFPPSGHQRSDFQAPPACALTCQDCEALTRKTPAPAGSDTN